MAGNTLAAGSRLSEVLSTPTRLRWLSELETLLGQNVSLVLVSADLDPVLGMELVRHGRLIYEREPELWLHHRAQLWHAYNDSLPFLRAARQRLREFAEEVRREMTADSRPQTAKKSGQDLHD